MALPPFLLSLLTEWSKDRECLEDFVPGHISDCSPPDLLSCGTQCLNLFVQLNWTGPPGEKVERKLEAVVGKDGLDRLNSSALTALSVDGETVHRLCVLPLLLYISKLFLLSPQVPTEADSSEVKRWAMRCVYVQQRLLSGPSPSLWAVLSDLVTDLQSAVQSSVPSQEAHGELYLELGHVCLCCLQYGAAKSHFEAALRVSHISTELTGVMGKRTRFQQKDIAQLILKVSTNNSETPPTSDPAHSPAADAQRFPREVALEDDTILDKINLTEPQNVGHLSLLQQAALLGWCVYHRKSRAIDQLSSEEMEAYLNCVLTSAQCWAIQGHALFLRTQLDKTKFRVQQRNMQQLEELVNCFQREVPEVSVRLKLFYAVPYSPLWTLQEEFAGSLVKMGCLSSAVEVLTRLQMWEELAVCYHRVGRKAKAIEVVREQLTVRATPPLLCLLGDITQDADCYRQAWELSGARSSRAQRSLGLLHLRKEEYGACVQCLQESLSLNSLQEGLWFTLGCAASQVDQIDLAISAWHHEVALQPDFAEAWNNLAGAYLKKDEKQRAHRIFKEALRCSYDNAKIWENYLVVSAELRVWEETLRAYQRLLDVQEKFLDVEVLTVLVGGVTRGCPEKSLAPACEYRHALGQLLGRITSRGQVPAEVWRQYAQFHLASSSREDHVKGVQELQKAQRAARLQADWHKTLQGLSTVSQFTIAYCRGSRELFAEGSAVQEKKQALATLSSAKLALQGVVTKTKSFGVGSEDTVQELLGDLETEMRLILEALTHYTT